MTETRPLSEYGADADWVRRERIGRVALLAALAGAASGTVIGTVAGVLLL